jgi:hypothetical protein
LILLNAEKFPLSTDNDEKRFYNIRKFKRVLAAFSGPIASAILETAMLIISDGVKCIKD